MGCLFGVVSTILSLGCVGFGLYAGTTHRYAHVNDRSSDNVNNVVRYLLVCFKIGIGIGGASSIAFVEETIKINGIDLGDAGLSSTSQLIPFIVGVFSLVNVLWSGFKKWQQDENDGENEARFEQASQREVEY